MTSECKVGEDVGERERGGREREGKLLAEEGNGKVSLSPCFFLFFVLVLLFKESFFFFFSFSSFVSQ